MKNVLLFWLLAFPFSCSDKEAALQKFIPGAYARSVQNEFSLGKDTLIIRERGNNQYSIDRLLTYQRISDGKRSDPEKKQEYWTALYDEKRKALIEQRRGRILTFQPDKAMLLVGRSVYKKIE